MTLRHLLGFLGLSRINSELLFCALVVFAVESIYIFLPDRLTIPQETHFFINQLDIVGTEHDVARDFYGILKTPVYNYIGFLFKDPLLFSIASYVFHIAFSLFIFHLIFCVTKNPLSATIVYLVICPLAATIVFKISSLWFLPSPRTAFEWGNVSFSVRLLIGFIYLAATYLYSQRRILAASAVLISSVFTHPNSAVYCIGILLLSETLLGIRGYSSTRQIGALIATSVITLLIIYSNIHASPGLTFEPLSGVQRYETLIRDEADDFSIYWHFVYQPGQTAVYFLALLLTCHLYTSRLQKKATSDRLFLLAIIPFVLYIVGLLVELVISRHESGFITDAFIGLQPGHKLLSFSFFPLVLMWSVIIRRCSLLNVAVSGRYYGVSAALACSALVVVLINNKNIEFLHAVKNIEITPRSYEQSVLLRAKLLGGKNPSVPKIYRLSRDTDYEYNGLSDLRSLKALEAGAKMPELDTEFNRLYADIDAFEEFISMVRSNVPLGSGIVIPPYLFFVRDVLPEYEIFFQEHHDGNIMMGTSAATSFFLDRMAAILGSVYREFPTQQSGLNYSFMRQRFLEFDAKMMSNLKASYPNFNYLITESDHTIDVRPIAVGRFYSLYPVIEI